MIRDLEIRNDRLAEAFDLHVLAVILTDWNRRIDDVGDCHHNFLNLLLNFFLLLRQFIHTTGIRRYLCLYLCGFLLLTLTHQSTNLLGQAVALRTENFYLLLDLTVLLIQHDHFIHQRKLGILELVADVLLYDLRILT